MSEVRDERAQKRIQELIIQAQNIVSRRTDRIFIGLLLFQWLGGIFFAFWTAPLTWNGATASTHPHVWAAVFLGLAIISAPVALGLLWPRHVLTRHIIAIGQMLSSGLLIHLTGGRLETHFHIFGSLAFLAFYRDWRVLITATLVTALDHFARGLYWPESFYGTSIGAHWRWIEHAGWVVFTDIFLIYSCCRGQEDIKWTAEKQVELERARENVEQQVRERTRELAESEERFRGALEHAAIGMALVAPDGRWLRVNRALCQITGYTAEEMLRMKFQDITYPADLPADAKRLDCMLNEGVSTYHMEKRYIHKHGHVVWVLLITSLVRDAAGEPLHFISQMQDITDRRRSEEELRRTRGQLMDAIESLDAGFAMYGPDERVVVCNTKFRELYPLVAHAMAPGTSYEEIIRAAHRIISNNGRIKTEISSDMAQIDPFIRNFIETKSEDEFVAAQLAIFRGVDLTNEHPLHDRWIRMSDRHTRDGGLVSLRTDITALKRAQEAAEEASRAKSEFLANMSHEIRTPMNGILGLTDLLLETELSPEQRESLSLVKSSGDALLTVINDILDFSKIEAGKLDLDPIPFLLRDAVCDTLKSVALRAHAKGLELTCDIPATVPDAVVGDAGRLRQILTNLVGNAIKFTEKGEVGVRLELLSEADGIFGIRFSVRDTGIGIPKEKQGTIFDPFTQADGSTTRRFGGTGLGLTISTRLVTLMGGRIWVESEPGQGSTFSFEVRFEKASGSAIKTTARPLAKLRGLSVLVVDDNPTNRRVLQETLSFWEARPTCVDSGPAALAEIRRVAALGEPYPLILLDAMMPDMDGFSVAEQIAREPDLAGPAVMMLTSADRQGDAARCRAIGMAAYLVKPVKMVELQRIIAMALGEDGSGSKTGLSRGNGKKTIVPDTAPTKKRSLRILLAEDNAVNQRVAVRLLQGYGHVVVVANHGGEAVEALSKGPFDLVLMDVQMPQMDGFEATRAIREREAATDQHTPIIAMTAHAMKGDRERCLAAGMDEYLSKPLQREELLRILNWVAEQLEDDTTPPVMRGEEERPDSPATIDIAAAIKRLGGDEELFAELSELFRGEGPRMIQEIREALETGDALAVQRIAHGLKGAAGYLGGTQTVDAAYRLEAIGASGELAQAPRVFQELEMEVDRLLAELNARGYQTASV
jgi:PAS domain S-box-containing protein